MRRERGRRAARSEVKGQTCVEIVTKTKKARCAAAMDEREAGEKEERVRR
jgi:hypothetical protein